MSEGSQVKVIRYFQSSICPVFLISLVRENQGAGVRIL